MELRQVIRLYEDAVNSIPFLSIRKKRYTDELDSCHRIIESQKLKIKELGILIHDNEETLISKQEILSKTKPKYKDAIYKIRKLDKLNKEIADLEHAIKVKTEWENLK